MGAKLQNLNKGKRQKVDQELGLCKDKEDKGRQAEKVVWKSFRIKVKIHKSGSKEATGWVCGEALCWMLNKR